MRGDWRTNHNGNWILVDYDSLIATVFHKDDDTWGAYINGRLLAGSAENAEDMMEYVQGVLLDPASARYAPPKDAWQTTKKGGYYKRTHGTTVSVKQAKTGSWYASTRDGVLPLGGKPKWFATADEAMQFVSSMNHHS